MTFELTLTNVIVIVALFVSALWALVKLLIAKQEKRAVEREAQFVDRLESTNEAVKGLLKEHAELRDRVTRVEGQSEGMPTHQDLANLYERVNGVASQIENLAGEFKGAQSVLKLLHEYLLKGGRA